MDETVWPAIDVAGWAETKRHLHLFAQMLGKIRVALSPVQPNWMFTALYLTARGFTTGTVPFERTSFDVSLDVFASEIVVRRSTGDERRITLIPARTVADVYALLAAALRELGVACVISTGPQEVADTTPLHEDRRTAVYDPEAVQRWFRAVTASTAVFEAWRSPFFGRSGIQLWWGAFDLALLLFSGRHVEAPTDRGYLLRYDLDAELMNVGLYIGDERTPAFFYGYLFPQPAGAERLAVRPEGAGWSATYNEWTLPYERVREAADPEAVLRAFLDSIFEHAVTAAGWDREALGYIAPPPHRSSGDAR